MCKLKNYIKEIFPQVLKADTVNTLGDRKKYVGASDIGSCLRKAYLSKTIGEEHDVKQLIVFERGHIAENIVKKMLYGVPLKEQVEVNGKATNGYEIKAHIDFVVDFGKELVVIEVKSTSIKVDEPYESWILQMQLQMGLLHSQHKDKIIRGYVVAVNVNTGWHETFEVKPNKVLFEMAINKANILADALVKQQEPEATEQLYCSQCAFKGDCPVITKGVVEQLPEDVKEIVKKIKDLSSVEKEIKSLKSQLKEYMKATEKTRVKADDYTVSLVSVKGKKTVDTDLLKQMMPDVYNQFATVGRGYSYIKVA